ncbi:MaoC family dehydratase N-terminal domain-containing protein [Candidatus Skiveiella danica]|uniref:FAS1-like dehydratase domain-containing protein n=1 Tax=Candidatus Skiveiella danica TaxID=3386177 RepID=UPI0039B97E9F
MIDKSIIELELPPFAHPPDADQLRFFAKSIGETDPIYSEESAAKRSWARGSAAAPLFFSAEMYRPADHGEWREKAGITL